MKLIAVGSNIAPSQHIPAAIERLSGVVQIRAASPTYQTPATGRDGEALAQDDFWNLVLQIETNKDRGAMQRFLRMLEADAGRVRSDDAYAARELDLDILAWDEPLPNLQPWDEAALDAMGLGGAAHHFPTVGFKADRWVEGA